MTQAGHLLELRVLSPRSQPKQRPHRLLMLRCVLSPRSARGQLKQRVNRLMLRSALSPRSPESQLKQRLHLLVLEDPVAAMQDSVTGIRTL